MKIVKVNDRHFVVQGEADVHDLSLKVLNELRVMGELDYKLHEVVERVCDEMDGEFAWEILRRVNPNIEVVPAEPVR